MEKIYTVGSKDNTALMDLGYEFIEFDHVVSSDLELHNFLVNEIISADADKLIIEIYKDDLKSLKLAYHIRLSLNELKSKSLIPIIFVSDRSLKQIISSSGIWGHIFATKGVSFTSFDLVKFEIENLGGIKSNEYRMLFLDLINVLPDETIGKHSIANQWGAFVMDKAANTFAFLNDSSSQKVFKRLYFKFSDAFNFRYELLNSKPNAIIGNIAVGKPDRVEAGGYKILLIDDEADKGWEQVLRKVFQVSTANDFQVINEQVRDYDSLSADSKKKITEGDFDLFLIDLRLNGAQEEDVIDVHEFSGVKILKEIKKNRGNQIIIFTASNKAWNIEPLLNLGADAYYIKESPEYKFSRKISAANFSKFKNSASRLLKRNYLRQLFSTVSTLKTKMDDLKVSAIYSDNFLDEISKFLDQSLDMHYKAKEQREFAFAYITLYMIFERINREFISAEGDGDDKRWLVAGENLIDWGWEEKKLIARSPKIIGAKPPEWQKLVGVWKQRFNVSTAEDSVIRPVQNLITMRNDFIHNNAELDNKIFSEQGFRELFKVINIVLMRL